ncbi:hypothetical protein EPUL_006096, partial [Erysiphe pulchra]
MLPIRKKSESPSQISSYIDRPFRIPVLVNAYKLGQLFQVRLKPGTTQADQGSDINIISDKLAKDLRLKPIKLGPHIALTMGTANGESTPLYQYAEIKICVEDIWRTIQVFVRPPTSNDRSTLILGLPWLYDVDASIKIRKFQIEIGDRSKGEKRRTIQTSQFKPAVHHRLSLIPVESKNHDLLDNLPVESKPPLESSSDSQESDSSVDEEFLGKGDVTSATLKHHYQKNYSITKPHSFPTLRRPVFRPLSSESKKVIETWFNTCLATIGDICSDENSRFQVKRLLYTYRDLDAGTDVNLPATDLYVHKIHLKPGTKPWNMQKQKRWPKDQEWWLNKIVTESWKNGMHEPTVTANGELSEWNAQARLVPKSDD